MPPEAAAPPPPQQQPNYEQAQLEAMMSDPAMAEEAIMANAEAQQLQRPL